MVMPPPEEEVLKLLHYSAIHPLSENLSCLMCFIKNFSSSDRILCFIDIVRNDQGCAVFFLCFRHACDGPCFENTLKSMGVRRSRIWKGFFPGCI